MPPNTPDIPRHLSRAALVLLALAPFAFWPAYLSRWGAADGYTHAHAALGTCWLLLLVAQPRLLSASRRLWHRYLGRAGVAVGAAFVVSGVLTAHRGIVRMSPEQFTAEGRYVYLPLAMVVIFGAALCLAVVWRRVAPIHGRFMAATALALLDPLFARLLFHYAPPLPVEDLYQVPAFGLSTAALVFMMASVPPTAAGRRPLLAFAAGVAVILVGHFVVPHTTTWLSFAEWFRDLPLTPSTR